MSANNVIYVFRGDEEQPIFKEESVPGAFSDVLDFVKKLADSTAGFIMGQVLASDGQVMATVAPGAAHLNNA